MALRVEGAGVSCDADGCIVPLNGDFTLSVVTDGPPAGGYIAVQTHVYYGPLTYLPTDDQADENVWPENVLPVRTTSVDQFVAHGGLTSLTAPFTSSTFEGALVELAMRCAADDATVRLALLSYNRDSNVLGSSYSLEDNLLTVSATVIGQMELDPLGDGNPRSVDVSGVFDVTCGAGGTIVAPPLVTAPAAVAPTSTPEPPERTATAESQVAAAETQVAEATDAVETSIALGTPAPTEIGGGAATPGEDGGEEDGDDGGGGNTGLWIVIGVVVAVALVGTGVVGWRYWRQRQSASGDAGPPGESST